VLLRWIEEQRRLLAQRKFMFASRAKGCLETGKPLSLRRQVEMIITALRADEVYC
jgi:hypothetical protein